MRMAPRVKFCGLTRRADVDEAVACGAAYVGVIFASGPRLQTPAAAAALLAGVAGGVRRVGVFGTQAPEEIARVAAQVPLDVVQLHADPTAELVRALRPHFAGEIWAALRVPRGDAALPAHAAALFAAADGVVLDAWAPAQLGGTGLALEWAALRDAVHAVRGTARGDARLVLAGGLRAENVEAAARALAPDVVDVSSGVESAPGIKDPSRLRAFRDAVRALEVRT